MGRKIHPDDRERVMTAMHDALQGDHESWSQEYRFRKKDHAYATLLHRGFIARDASGRAKRMVGSMMDLTERKQVSDALLASQKRFHTIVDQTISGVVQTDADGRMTLVNQCWCDMLGYSEAELLQMNVFDVTHEDSLAATRTAISRLADGGPSFFIDKCYVRKDKSVFWASSNINALRSDAGEFLGMVAVVLDITKRRNIEEALRQSETNSRDILQSITEGFLAFDENWRFTYVNRAAETLLERKADDLMGKNFWTEYPGVVGTDFERNYRQVSVTREAITFTNYYPEHKRWYEIHVYPSAKGLCLYFSDATERLQTQDRLRARHERFRLIASISSWLVLQKANAETKSVDTLLESVFLDVARHLDAEYYFNFSMIDDTQRLRLVSSSGIDVEQQRALAQINIGEYLCGSVALSRQPLVLRDLQTCTGENVAVLSNLGVRAYAGFPLLADGKLLGTVSFATAKRAAFDEEELELIQTVADLLAAAIQRERSNTAIQISEKKYRNLFQSIDEAFCTVEIIHDDDGNPVDYRYLETNLAFERHTRLADPAGKTVRQLLPTIEQWWIDSISQVARTGVSLRFENYAAPLERWFNCYVFDIDDTQAGIVGIIFSDITERKRRELNLALLTEIQQDLVISLDMRIALQTVGMKICRHFHFADVAFADIDLTAETASAIHVSRAADVDATSGTHLLAELFNQEQLDKLKVGQVVAINNMRDSASRIGNDANPPGTAGSVIHVPRLGDGVWKFLLSGTHHGAYRWRTDEIELLDELMARICLHLERARAEIRIRESEGRYRALMETFSQMVYRMNANLTQLVILKDGGLMPLNPDLKSDWLNQYVHPEDRQLFMKTWHKARQNNMPFELEHRVRRRDGSWGWIFSRAIPLHDAKGNIVEWFGSAHDINDRKHFEDTLWQGANFDSLTGLPNRRLFRDRLEQEIRKSHRSGLAIGLFFIDLDRFKQLNDLHGHVVGDQLLIEASRRISACVREFDTVARLGGDEFTAILSELQDRNDSEQIARKMLDALAKPFQLGRELVHLSSSIGITYFPDDAATADGLIRNADQAMYSAKYAGRNQYKHFVQRMQHEALDRLRLIEDLRDAACNGQFEVCYQPVVDLASGRIVKAEALLRWHHPAQGNIDPSVFIPFAEDSGLINEIGDWVFTEAAACAKMCGLHTGGPFQISVNKSPLQFSAGAQAFDWIDYLQTQQQPASSISIEITEGLLLNTSEETRSKLMALRNAGMEVAIDDFGTGYSSMAYLKEFEIDYLKIDQSFISNMAGNKASFAIIRSIIAMAHELDIKVIAEGIETLKQQQLLIDAGCDFGQGYLFSEAIPCAQFMSKLQQDRISLH